VSLEQKCAKLELLKGSEFKRKVEKLAKDKHISCLWDKAHGKGSHGRLFLGEKFTTLKDLKKEIGPGLLGAMCFQLGIRKEDLK